MRQLAILLGRAGFSVLRFDYFGCGDSAGGGDEGSLEQWTEDTAAAVDELRDYAQVRHVSLIGLRLGASLAALVGSDRRELRGAVLWEPIVSGTSYVEELLSLHNAWLQAQEDGWATRRDSQGTETLGFLLTPSMREQLERMDLLNLGGSPSKRVLIVEQHETAAAKRLVEVLRRLDSIPDYRCLPAARFWLNGELDSAQVPLTVVEAIVSWMCEATP